MLYDRSLLVIHSKYSSVGYLLLIHFGIYPEVEMMDARLVWLISGSLEIPYEFWAGFFFLQKMLLGF